MNNICHLWWHSSSHLSYQRSVEDDWSRSCVILGWQLLFWCWQFFCQRGSNLLQLSSPQYFCMQYNAIYRTIQGNTEKRRHFYEVQTCRNCRARIWDLQHIGRQSHNLRIPLGTVRLLCSIRHHFRCNLSMIIRHLNGKNISVTKLGTIHLDKKSKTPTWNWIETAVISVIPLPPHKRF